MKGAIRSAVRNIGARMVTGCVMIIDRKQIRLYVLIWRLQIRFSVRKTHRPWPSTLRTCIYMIDQRWALNGQVRTPVHLAEFAWSHKRILEAVEHADFDVREPRMDVAVEEWYNKLSWCIRRQKNQCNLPSTGALTICGFRTIFCTFADSIVEHLWPVFCTIFCTRCLRPREPQRIISVSCAAGLIYTVWDGVR